MSAQASPPGPASGQTDAPLISVIVPVFDVADHVGAAIASLRAQTLDDFEALVIDDGSTDGSGTVARAAWGDDPRFRLIVQPNRGLSGARNTGLDAARGEYVAFLDSDDRYHPRFLEVLLGALRASGPGRGVDGGADGGADWVACAIDLCFPDGARIAHPAIHGVPGALTETWLADDRAPPAPLPVSLADARTVARHFPSAWNKLYRRDFIGDLRFDDGTWYEDHSFYWQLAARTPVLAYVARPLYLHSRDRPGQITGADDDRVFQQLAVLERLAGLVRGSGRRGAEPALARLATRLIHERLDVLQAPARRAAFLRAAAAFMARHGLDWSVRWDRSLRAVPGLALDLAGRGIPVLSVLVVADEDTDTRAGAVQVTLDALGAQSLRDFEVVVRAPTSSPPAPPSDSLSDSPSGALSGRLANGVALRGLAPDATPGVTSRVTSVPVSARSVPCDPAVAALLAAAPHLPGRHVMVLRAGTTLAPDALEKLMEAAVRHDATLAGGGFAQAAGAGAGGERRIHHPGHHMGHDPRSQTTAGAACALHPAVALRLQAEVSARILRRDRLAALPPDLRDRLAGLPVPLAGQGLLLALAGGGGRMVHLPDPGLVLPPAPAVPGPRALADALRGLAGALPPQVQQSLPPGWQGLLLARALQLRHFADGRRDLGARLRRLGMLAAARAVLARAAWQQKRGRHTDGLRGDPDLPGDPDLAPLLRRLIRFRPPPE